MAAAARTAVRGLSDTELQTIRVTLAAGRKPKVKFTEAAGQMAGQVGQVVELTDPAASDEWVVVRFGRDELPFSPTDLSVLPRGSASRRGGARGNQAQGDRPRADKPRADKPRADKPRADKPRADKPTTKAAAMPGMGPGPR